MKGERNVAPNTVAVWRMQALLGAVMVAVVGVVTYAVMHAAAGFE